ncbi:alginate lyase family protein [Algibacillus agarilyticus]|uniref:alginate lyase family protein n=1 Tax=Algibacillus agarilyticus TaxID=2234133 RepID=UPI000DCF6E42|nr:alginate lyase family protein [Algibacillus agarilyticus]
MQIKRTSLLASILSLSVTLTACQNTIDTGSAPSTKTKSSTYLYLDENWLNDSYQRYQAGDPVRQLVVKRLITKAEQGLTKGPVSVLDKSHVPPSGDKHDYISIGPYWWPDPTKPDGLPWKKRDGKVNPTSATGGTDKTTMNNMLFQISDLTLAYHYTKEEKYAKHAALLIKNWFLDPATRMNPSLNFGQAVPGDSDGRKYGIIETRWFIRLIDDVNLLSHSKHFTHTDENQFKTWISDYLTWLQTNELGKGACDAHNNHGTYCEAQVAAYALYTGDKALAREYVERIFKHRLPEQVKPTGAQPDELARTRPLHYSVFNLEAYLYAARVADQLGLDYWQYKAENGVGLQEIIDFLLPAIKKQGYWANVKDKKMRRGRLYYFLQYAYQRYGDDKYRQAIEDLYPLIIKEDRSELAQCFLIMPKPDSVTLDLYKQMDPTGKKSGYRCYY